MSVNKYYQISNNLRLTFDKYQYIIEVGVKIDDKESERDGEINWRNEAYLPTIKDVLRYLADHEIKDNIENIYIAADWTKSLEDKLDILVEAEINKEKNGK